MIETFRLTERLPLRAPDGSEVVVEDAGVRLEREGDRVVDVWLIGELVPAAWTRVDAGGWFHLAPDARGPSFGGPFQADVRVKIEARLAPATATALALLAEDEWTLLAELLGARLLRELHETETWYALYVTQPRGPVRGGFRTRHADLA